MSPQVMHTLVHAEGAHIKYQDILKCMDISKDFSVSLLTLLSSVIQ